MTVVANMANQSYSNCNTIGFPETGLRKVRFKSDWNGYGSDFGNHFNYHAYAHLDSNDGMLYNGNVGIGPYRAIIHLQDNA